ncbi:MAG TPA: archease [Methanocella sp.]|nr:archease [Methanocella sp.]
MDFKYLEHTADAEFIAYGRTVDEAFANAARATFGLMVDLAKVRPAESREIRLAAGSLDDLLFDWLSELLYLVEVDRLIFSQFDVAIAEDGDYRLTAVARGEKVRPGHGVFLHVKAVTYHDLRVEKRNNVYEAQVLLDI